MFLRNRVERGIVGEASLGQRAIGGQRHAVLLQHRQHRGLIAQHMVFDLVAHDRCADHLNRFAQQRTREVRHPDMACKALFLKFHQLAERGCQVHRR